MPEPSALFVCTGNICRSPMAEYLLRQRLPAGSPWRCLSAGTAALDGAPASGAAIAALAELGIDLSPHRSRQLTMAHLQTADIVLVMTRSHRDQIRDFMPEASERLFLIRDFDPDTGDPDIADPIGAPLPVYRRVRDEIGGCIDGLLPFLAEFRRA